MFPNFPAMARRVEAKRKHIPPRWCLTVPRPPRSLVVAENHPSVIRLMKLVSPFSRALGVRSLLLISLLFAVFALTRAVAQQPLVVVDISGTQFGNATPIHVDSGATKLQAATSYTYKIEGTVHGTGTLALLIPNGKSLTDFIEDLETDGSAFLQGTQPNPGGTLPFTVIDRTYTGSVSAFGQTFAASLKIRGSVAADGTVSFDVTDVVVTLNGAPFSEKIVFETGSKLTVGVTPVVQWNAATAQVDEDAGNVVLTVQRTANAAGEVKVNFATADGSATQPGDFTTTTGQLTFADGDTSETVTVPIINNNDPDGARTFTVTLSNPLLGALGATTQITVTIVDDEVAAVVQFAQAAVSVGENAGTLLLDVQRTGSTVGAAKVKFQVTAGTAKAGQDFRARPGTLTFANGVASQQIEIAIVDDLADNPDLNFTVKLTAPLGAVLGAADTATVTITDDDVSYAPNAGTYAGLVAGASLAAPNAGRVTLTLLATGAFTAKLVLAGKTYTVRGTFPASGIVGPLPFSTNPPRTLSLNLNLATNELTGTINDTVVPAVVANLAAARSTFTKDAPFDRLGVFNMLLEPEVLSGGETPATFPTGYGFGKATVKAPNTVKFVGKLADGTKVTASGLLTNNRECVLYAPLYSKGGLVQGTLTILPEAAADDLTGTWRWIKPQRPTDKVFPGGFDTTLTLHGELFVKPVTGALLLDFTASQIDFGDGNVGGPFVKDATIGDKNAVTITTNPDAHQVKFKITGTTGAFSGSFVPTGSTKAKTFTGLILPKRRFGAGFFVGTQPTGQPVESGFVTFGPP